MTHNAYNEVAPVAAKFRQEVVQMNSTPALPLLRAHFLLTFHSKPNTAQLKKVNSIRLEMIEKKTDIQRVISSATLQSSNSKSPTES